ncbi:MAG: selenium cofactor biosynthesis protein YqeC [Anaerolineae bacterium]|nr:selenium cofactor biosynthesis protein YqeC [Thermoflexales bacterium]MDW8408925.1 selenium cofactor biosynthesis protein YqeC [Anaerolineae bacterium]
MMALVEALGVAPGDCVAVVGAGGKTSLCWQLTRELAQRGQPVVFTTTTHIRQPARGAFGRLIVTDDLSAAAEQISHALRTLGAPTLAYAARTNGLIDDTPVIESFMPAIHTKLSGFDGESICRLRAQIQTIRIGEDRCTQLTWLVEADGARGLLLKAPAGHEPAIPACADIVCVVANLEALGRPLDERVAHRVERITALIGAQAGAPITPQMMVDVLTHPEGGLKHIPAGARPVAVLNQHETTLHPLGVDVAARLAARGFARVVVASLRQAQPVLHVMCSAKKLNPHPGDAG